MTVGGAGRPGAGDGRLRGWKEIASYFGADERTAKRWEGSRGLPIHRVPGDARAPVFAYESELAGWLNSRATAATVERPTVAAVAPAGPPPRRGVPFGLAVAGLLLLALGLVAWAGWQRAAAERRLGSDRVADVRHLAGVPLAKLSDRLERQPGTVRMRAALARDAASVLARVAAVPEAAPALRQEAAEAYRRLAVIQNATDRPSLRDRPAARDALALALRLVADDPTPAGRWLAARILIDSARQAAADGAVAVSPAMLAEAAQKARDGPVGLQEELVLGSSEIAIWQGNYTRALNLAMQVPRTRAGDAATTIRHLRAIEMAAEAHFYAGDKPAALTGYRLVAAEAAAAQERWPADPRLRWALQRQEWNLGSTLTDAGRAGEALLPLRASRDGWLAMARVDPEDEALASWVRTARVSYGEALAGAGRTAAAIDELAGSLADRRTWLAGQPASAERRRALIVGLNPLADTLASAGRRGEACALYSEAVAMARRMAASGNLTALDRESLLKQLGDSVTRYCPRIDDGRPLG